MDAVATIVVDIASTTTKFYIGAITSPEKSGEVVLNYTV